MAAMNMRGAWAPRPPNTVILNVTSSQPWKTGDREAFSPMTPGDVAGDQRPYWNFEAHWQAGKKWNAIPHETSIAWWRAQTSAKRRYPGSKRMVCDYSSWPEIEDGAQPTGVNPRTPFNGTLGNHCVLRGEHEGLAPRKLDRVSARKLMYVPLYSRLVAARSCKASLLESPYRRWRTRRYLRFRRPARRRWSPRMPRANVRTAERKNQ